MKTATFGNKNKKPKYRVILQKCNWNTLRFAGRHVRGHMTSLLQMKTQHYSLAKEETEYFCTSNQREFTSLDGNTCVSQLYFGKILEILLWFSVKSVMETQLLSKTVAHIFLWHMQHWHYQTERKHFAEMISMLLLRVVGHVICASFRKKRCLETVQKHLNCNI